MLHSDYIVYVDESGDHSLESVDPQFPVFALTFCIFRKNDYITRVVPAVLRLRTRYMRPENPYAIALLFRVERLYAFLRDWAATDRTTHVIVECRGKKEDAALELEFRRIIGGANRWGAMNCLELVFTNKKANSPGLQLADLTARPIGLKVMRPDQANRAYDIIESKIRRSPQGRVQGWGFKVFP